MRDKLDILCIGSVLWDVIGRSSSHVCHGADVPGRITRLPGGVAMNIAMTLSRFGLRPALLSAVGNDAEGHELIEVCQELGVITTHIFRAPDLPTDRYLAVEGANGLIAAIADAHSLEVAGAKILTPLANGTLASEQAPFDGFVALDGNLTQQLLENIASSPLFAKADLRVAPASPGKASRLLPFLNHHLAVLYVNLEEAGLLCQAKFESSAQAAQALVARGAKRALVTDGDRSASDATPNSVLTQVPPSVLVTRVTGAGDTFMAAHIAAEIDGQPRDQALNRALTAAAYYVSGGNPK